MVMVPAQSRTHGRALRTVSCVCRSVDAQTANVINTFAFSSSVSSTATESAY